MTISVDQYIKKQKSLQQEICQHLRKIILEVFPNIKEEMKWGVPAFAEDLYYIVALKDHVNLGFFSKGLSKEELALFDGGGKITKHIEVRSLEMDRERIVKLLKLVKERQG